MDKNIVVFGTGTLAGRYCDRLPMERVVCFVDNDTQKQNQTFFGKPVLPPERLRDIRFDRLVIFVSRYYMQIYRQLTEKLHVEKSRISFWGHFLQIYDSGDAFHKIYRRLTDGTYETVADYNAYLAAHDPFIRKNGGIRKFFGCAGSEKPLLPIYVNLYDSVFENTEELAAAAPDLIVLGDIRKEIKPPQLEAVLERCFQIAAAVCLTVPYPDSEDAAGFCRIDIEKYGKVSIEDGLYERIIYIEKPTSSSVHIYIAAHRPFTPPDNPIYRPLWLGGPEENHWNYQNDRQGKNISRWNPLINECTGLYWIWKNVDCDIAGMVHYRRYFLKNDLCRNRNNLLDEGAVLRILQHYDMIVNQVKYLPDTMAGHLAKSIQPEAFQTGWELIYNAVAKHQPEYLNLFQEVMEGHYAFFCNMFITRKEILDDYCEWLFSILPDAVNQADVSGFEPFSKRVIGFFAERLFTVWLCGQKLLLKQLPMLFEG